MARSLKPVALFLTVLVIGAFTLKMRSVSASIHEEAMSSDERYYLPPSTWLRFMSLGFNEAAADLVWIKTVVYFGGRFLDGIDDAKSNYTVNYLKTAVELDPHMRTLYLTGSSLTLFQNAGIVSEATVKMAIELLEKGAEVFPDDGAILFALGFYHHYEMRPFVPRDPEDPKRKYHEELGAKYIGRSSMLEGAPPYASLLATTLLQKHGFDDIIIDHLRFLLVKEVDPKVRETLKRRLREELGKAAERDIAESERLVAKWQRDLPFVPYDFFLVLQPAASARELVDPLYYPNKLLGLDESTDSAFKKSPNREVDRE